MWACRVDVRRQLLLLRCFVEADVRTHAPATVCVCVVATAAEFCLLVGAHAASL
jgi:hypothetical protein